MATTQSKVVLLTGASRGIGLSVAEYLLSRPAKHRLVVSARSESQLLQLSNRYPSRVAVISGDHCDVVLGQKLVKLGISKFQRLDSVIVNHATVEPVMRLADSSVHEWKKAYDVNFFSAVSILQTAIPYLRASRGRVVLVSSTSSISPYRSVGAYGSTKAALNHLAMVLDAEEEAITAVAIRPGEVDTELQRSMREKHAQSGTMPLEDSTRFHELKKNDSLLPPNVPARVVAGLALNVKRELGGRLYEWDDKVLSQCLD